MVTQLLSMPRAAELLDCSPGHVYGLIAAGKLRAVEIKATGKRPKTRVREDDLQAYIDAQTRGDLPATYAVRRRPGLHSDVRTDVPAEGPWSSVQAAQVAEVRVDDISAALRADELHGTRATPRGRWRIEPPCLDAWLRGERCAHQEGGGEAKPVDSDGS